MQRELFAAGMDAAVFSSLMMSGNKEFDAAENAVYDLICADNFDGIILCPHTINHLETRERLTERIRREYKGPLITFDSAVEGIASSVYNYEEAAELIVSHVCEVHNATRVDYIGGQEDFFHNSIDAAFMKAFKKHGITPDSSHIHHVTDWLADYTEVVDKILADKPQAVLCCSDIAAAQVISCLTLRGVSVPEDIIVTGLNHREPYDVDYINITSIIRNPEAIARNTARYIISKINGTEYQPLDESNSAILYEGISCGCRRVNIGTMCDKATFDLTRLHQGGYESYYNFMSEDLVAAESLEDFLWKTNWYTHFLGDFSGIWICLNDKVMHNPNPGQGLTDKISLPLARIGDNAVVDKNRSFDRSELLPAISESNSPRGYIFTSLHFMGVNYGYVALSFGDSGRLYNRIYIKWLRCISCALEKQRRHLLYNDTVMDSQIRDALTGLFNMRGYTKIMRERCGKFNDPTKLLRIISVDVENLKGINDIYGYNEGDRVLTGLGIALSRAAGDNDIVVRVSGDEFFIAGIIDEDSVDDVPSRLGPAIEALNHRDNAEYGINVHMASASAPLTDKSVLEKLPYEAAYHRSIAKDHQSKLHKSAEISNETFDPEERQKVIRLLNENLFSYHYQPIVKAENGEIYAYEALMRSGEQFRLSPIAILNHAEALDRLSDVEKCTMFNTMKFARENREKLGDKLLFINSIPACTLPDYEFEQLFELYGDIMKNIVIEFTEQTRANDTQLASLLGRSRRCGFQIAIDDYGTGYSNVENLLEFSPNVVKIDRVLIMNIHKDKRKKHFTQNIIDYAHDNHFMALAEGVETAEELQTVIAMGVDLIQGYYTAKPSAEPIPSIRPEIIQEIKEYNRRTDSKRTKKTYFTAEEREISLMALDLDGYTDLIVNKPEYTLIGNKNFVSEMTIRTKDNAECSLNLIDISMTNETAGACIIVGQNSTVTLNIIGEVSVAGGIYVPEGSSLKITGGGSLSIKSASNQSYAIGSGYTSSYGNIDIDMQGGVYIHLDSESSVAIGGKSCGENSSISICCKDLVIEQSGKTSIGIGSVISDAKVSIHDTHMTFEQHSRTALGIGSLGGRSFITVQGVSASFTLSGDKIGEFASFNSIGGSISIAHANIKSTLKGKEILAIGADHSFGKIKMSECTFNVLAEGAQAVIFGSADCDEGWLEINTCSGDITVHSGCKTLLGVKPEQFISISSKLNFIE